MPCLRGLVPAALILSSALAAGGCRPAPPPPAVQVKVPLPPPPAPEEPARFRSWRDVLRQLPKDGTGGVDWVRALEEKAIEPRPGVDPTAKDEPVFLLEIDLVPEAQPTFKVTFPHKAHTEWLACTNCHFEIFQMRRGAARITMEKIYAGEYCGRCHGKVAFAVPTGCPRCHHVLAPPRPAAPPPGG